MVWDARFAGAEYLFGTEPAAALPRLARHLPPASRVLSLAEGEGRNGVWLAGQGHHVTGLEPSSNARAKAADLAQARGVAGFSILDGDVTAALPGTDWDAIIGIFIQFLSAPERRHLHHAIARALRPGGILILHGYAPRQVHNGTGGPRQVENLYTLEGLQADFPGWQVLEARDYDAEISEGTGHHGRSALIDFVAVKP